MRTRSSSNLVSETSTNLKRRNRRRSKQVVEPFSLEETPVDTMTDQRTMAELLRAPTEGYAEAIVVPLIPADHFSSSIITSTLKYKDVLESSINGPAQIWLNKEHFRSILTWDDLVSKFINHFFPPSKTTNLHNEISNFQQRFDESFYEAWDHFKDLLRAYPHYGFTELHQLDTFYNGLNLSDQDSLNSATGGNLLERSAQDALKIIENKSKVRNSRNKLIVSQVKASNVDSSEIASAVASVVTSAMTAMLKQHQVTPAPASVKADEESCVTYGAATVNYNQGNIGYRPPSVANQTRPPGFAQPYEQNNQNRYNQGYNQNRGNPSYQAPTQQTQVTTSSELEKFKKTNQASMQAMRNHIGSLPINTIANPKGELKSITTRSGIALDGPSVPMPHPFINPEEDERAEETLTDPKLAEYTIKVPPPLVQKPQAPLQKSYEMPKRDPLHPNIPYPSRMYKEK
ncbi:reverse transcriptase domain-containing protein [Tanacetum coccineum]